MDFNEKYFFNFHWRSLVNGLQCKIFFNFHWRSLVNGLQWKNIFKTIEVYHWRSRVIGNNIAKFRTYRIQCGFHEIWVLTWKPHCSTLNKVGTMWLSWLLKIHCSTLLVWFQCVYLAGWFLQCDFHNVIFFQRENHIILKTLTMSDPTLFLTSQILYKKFFIFNIERSIPDIEFV